MIRTKASANIGLVIGVIVVVAAGIGYFAFLKPTQIEPPAPPAGGSPPPAVTPPPVAPPPAGKPTPPPPAAATIPSPIRTFRNKAVFKVTEQYNASPSFYYELWYSAKDFTVSSTGNQVTLQEQSGKFHTISFIDPVVAGGSTFEYWEDRIIRQGYCLDPDCGETRNLTELGDLSPFPNSFIFANNKEEWVVYNHPIGVAILASFKKPSLNAKNVLASLYTYQANKPKPAKIKIGLLGEQEKFPGNMKIGCDAIVYVERGIDETPQVLNAALRELFSLKSSPAAMAGLGNSLSRQKLLMFDYATIESGVAKIYLTGQISGGGGVCDDPRLQAHLEGTAKQFSTVKSVEVYLNGKKVEWNYSQRG